ncbi:uncharacterized protein LOC125759691 [Rhipicephalus sanguineus]|uniref:uncharacterized protein LOC125759691 n=1 Tax=Rhipicephalus sanguineus TaxID=34632 RepID=UPI0020C35207|nr:uncharacterized protein LOC125759691 [Rhipicephalus sanguineus]
MPCVCFSLQLDATRNVRQAHCTCRGGISGQCKHAAAVVTFVNKEDTSTKTSVENVWKRPSAKQLGMYNKGVLFSEMYPPKPPDQKLVRQPVPRAIIDSNCPLGIMLRQEQEIAENLAHLDKVLGRLGQPSNTFGAESIPVEEVSDDFLLKVVVTEEERSDIAKQTILQSGCPQWHCARALRISASSKAHRIKIRQADFESLAQQLVTPRSFKSAACAYGISMEPVARKEYESKTGRKVIQVGLVISTSQPWLCCSPDGLIDEEGIRLLEIKAPYRCESRPVVDRDINVDYLHFNGKNLQLRESHPYYTQVQISMYVVGASRCDFYVYSPKGSKCMEVRRDDSFLEEVVPKLEWFFFRHYFPAALRQQSLC